MTSFIKRVLLIGGVVLLASLPLIAQNRAPRNNQPELKERLEQLKKDLSLTDEQLAQIKPLLEANRANNEKSRDEMRAELKSDRQNRRAMMTEMRKTTAENQQKLNASLKEILNKEQFEKLQEIQKKQREEMSKNRPNRN